MTWSNYRDTILATVDKESFYANELDMSNRRGSEIRCACPFASAKHRAGVDETPSFTVNLLNGVYYCQTCQSKGNVFTFYHEKYGGTKEEAWLALGDALNLERPNGSEPQRPPIEAGLVVQYHNALMNLTGPLREVLSKRRGLTDDTLKKHMLGWDGDRVSIPVYDEYNELVNIRLYKWNSDNDQFKVLNYKDELGNVYGEVRLFGVDNLISESTTDIVWCEGELDRIIAEQYGFKACCATSGAGTMKPEWIKLFRGKSVYLAQDNDEAGRRATSKLSQLLHKVCKVFVVQWPEGFPDKGDITDFFTTWKQDAKAFQTLLDTAQPFILSDDTEMAADDAELEETHLADTTKLAGKRMRVPVMVSGKAASPFICPKTAVFSCVDPGSSKKCGQCSLPQYGGEVQHTFSGRDKSVLKLVGCTDSQQVKAMCEILKIVDSCPLMQHKVLDTTNIEKLRLIPKAEANYGFNNVQKEYVVRDGFSFGQDLKANNRYSLYGTMVPSPVDQSSVFISDVAVPEQDMIGDFEITEEVVDSLKMFQLQPGQTIKQKFEEIHKDLEYNVTRIWQRRSVATAVDLVYHTVLQFDFQGQPVRRGWGELLIIGDSGQAKTTLVERIMSHYALGALYSGESSRRTGLVHSTQQSNGTWFLVWGAYPLNDGGLITLDELSGIDENTLSEMSDVRSSGIAKVNSVITAETNARTRAIFISNPRNGRQLNTETYGVTAILKLFGKAEDVRRLDLAIAVASNDVDAELINLDVTELQPVPAVYTSDICKNRVLWAWSRRSDEVEFTQEATKLILTRATEMGRRYSSKVPLVEAADQRLKIARLSIAAAACVASTDEMFEKIIVKPEHVEFVVDFMNETYATPSMGYDKFSNQEIEKSDTSDDNMTRLRKSFMLLSVLDVNALAKAMYDMPYFDRFALEDRTGLEGTDVRQVIKFMLDNSLVTRVNKGRDYMRLPIGTKLFENMVDNPMTKDEVNAARKELYTEV